MVPTSLPLSVAVPRADRPSNTITRTRGGIALTETPGAGAAVGITNFLVGPFHGPLLASAPSK